MHKVRLYSPGNTTPTAQNRKSTIHLSQGRSLPPPVLMPEPAAMPLSPVCAQLPTSPQGLSRFSSPTPSVLVIDDSLTIRKIIEATLRREGYTVIAFSEGMTALRWLATASNPVPRLLLLDIELPHMDGYAIARTLKAQPAFASLPILMMSHRDGVIDRLKGRLAGAEEYLTKPFTTKELMKSVRRYCGSATTREGMQ